MNCPEPRTRTVALAATCILLILPGALAQAADDPPASETPGEALVRDMDPMRMEIRNMETKIRKGVVSYSRKDSPDQLPVTGWIGRCCARNIRALKDRSDALYETTEILKDLFVRAGDLDGVAVVTEMQDDMKVLREKLLSLASVPDETGARTAIVHLTRAFLNVDQDKKKMEACCNSLEVPTGR